MSLTNSVLLPLLAHRWKFGVMSVMYANLPPGLLQYLFIHIIEHIFPKYKTEPQALQSCHWWLGLYPAELFALLFLEQVE